MTTPATALTPVFPSAYGLLDAVADSYIPLLLLMFLLSIVKTTRIEGARSALPYFVYLAWAALVCYGIGALDSAWNLWGALGLDYSTHTAVSLALSMGLWLLAPAIIGSEKPHRPGHTIYRVALATGFIVYLLLMRVQAYHSGADMLTTLAVVLLMLTPAGWWLFSRSNRSGAAKRACSN